MNKMPELPEIRVFRDYINRECEDLDFSEMISYRSKHPNTSLTNFYLSASARGKELKLNLSDSESDEYMLIRLGMSGKFVIDDPETCPEKKHIAFYFLGRKDREKSLLFIDQRRFAGWEVSKTNRWGPENKRGPDCVSEHDDFVKNIKDSRRKKIFNKPIYELMLDQKYFNGIGNYLRAEILYEWGRDPHMYASEAVKDEELLELCRKICKRCYKQGGAEIYTWKNPIKEAKSVVLSFKCYRNPEMCQLTDSGKRTFWYDPKFK